MRICLYFCYHLQITEHLYRSYFFPFYIFSEVNILYFSINFMTLLSYTVNNIKIYIKAYIFENFNRYEFRILKLSLSMASLE
jgi:hypothetical protein